MENPVMIDPRRTFSDSHPPKEWSTEQEIHISSFSSRWNRPSSEIIPKPFIWTGGNADICKDPSAHSYHNPPKPSATFPPAKRAVANLFMQGWQWRQPDHAQRENSNQLLGSKAQYGMLDAVGRHLQHWWYLQSCWVLMAGFLWKQANHHGHLLLMSKLSILAGLLSGSTAHSLFSLQPQSGYWMLRGPAELRVPTEKGKESKYKALCPVLCLFRQVSTSVCALFVRSGWHCFREMEWSHQDLQA